ncbi:carboxymuconolactone decarboxylase family protein [Flavobacterium sp. KACC 22758]|jgi:AhpD family alkylhydroperoxidase|uniref:carboxymuconolactone decarboxylase family protein n=1 Tax=Flavobacterium sp. KACC 22758 TaxID=3025667 RepID=UPI0023654598|nr:carboxymuconolactone decarboxylase family protein [Flavobacterium sp. KACC 22758]WDF59641.1 carboxymuconolactone decarboxylase family protein [Flavobacterium sp. KACC 22758]
MDYIKISQETIGHLYKAHTSVRKSEIDIKLLALTDLRVSQLNGCAYCCSFHSNELREFGIEQNLLDKLSGWKLSDAFDEKQKLALEWAEAITKMETDLTAIRKRLEIVFTEKELVDLTASISIMNTLNRLRITLGDNH